MTLVRFAALFSIILGLYHYYNLGYVIEKPPEQLPYPLMMMIVVVGNLSCVYTIEKYEKKLEIFIGYLGLCAFFIVTIGGVFFDW